MCECVVQEAILLATSSTNPLAAPVQNTSTDRLPFVDVAQTALLLTMLSFLDLRFFQIFDAAGQIFFEKYQPLN